jgi:glutamate-1-semialdehyde 2,1-aminomutase
MTAGIETLKGLSEPGVFDETVQLTTMLREGIGAAAEAAGISLYTTQAGTMFCFFFNEGPVTDWESAAASDLKMFGRFFHAMLDRGVYFPPSQFESWFFSTAHSHEVVVATIQAAQTAFGEIAEQ